ncbi:benzoate 1,2-dioxygenase electron transfer component BenC [Mycolicibacterium mageritense]|uniref:benzoate 1,2-dioxygenase electron transfer component BenC n=1 Tax=Mycolicibacterium mageritense TaxID=53462 RepID=UPI001E59EF9A|nr:benzoate 1,2-dioxygenase electron transfer component BenC [Mycolicibacterium mageritense]GJJ22035.1 oxidoreductase [Mycolicibacterium mageritense]
MTVTHSVALSFEDGVTRFITCRDDQTVADASYRQRINIPLDCRDGACGTCKARCESGEFDGGSYIEDALSADEARAGYVLPCSMKPRSDLVLQIASTSDIAKTRAATYTGTLVELTRLSPTIVRFAVEIPNRSELAFLPGQYVNIAVPGTDVTRSYSFANAPHEERLTFLVKLTPGGAMSGYLADRAAVGDTITFTGPNGSFFLREAQRPVLLLAGGTGLAPILSMLRAMRESGSPRKAHLIYGAKTDDDVVALDELAELASGLGGFTWEHCVSDPRTAAANQGRVMTLIRPAHLYNGDVAVYLCGPPAMVESVRSHVAEAGIEPVGFYYEKFALAHGGPAAAPAASPRYEVTETLLPAVDARGAAGQVMLAADAALTPWPDIVAAPEDDARRIVGQRIAGPATGAGIPLDADDGALIASGARAVAGQELFVRRPVAAPEPEQVSHDGYQIGEEHPEVHESDALFEARQALELGALELTLGRLSSRQLAGYRLLAESTMPYVEGDHFVDAAQYTETNAAFHDYLFTLTGNDHLLQAYQALGVKGRMAEVLRDATWCHPLCAQDHMDIVSAFEAGDRDAARTLIVAHAERSKQTMRRAMADHEKAAAARRPRCITPGRFTGKVVLVTGAAQGIGEHTARRISAEGGVLVLADRSDLVKELADELATGGPRTLAVTADLEHYDGAESVVRQAFSEFGRIDVLINNVGGAINFKPFTEFSETEIRAELDRSLLTTLYTCRAALPSMVAHGQGVIVNVSSAATRGIHRIPYSAAKGGINAITASLALEYADAGIRVVATAPGGTEAPPRRITRGTPEPANDTERAWYQAHIEQTVESSLMHRYGTLDEQAAAICFLASDEASYITGSVLPVAGGDQG